VRRHALELAIVFVGVYAAFLLNRFDSARHDARQRAQIVGALVREVAEQTDELKRDIAQADQELSDFRRQLAAGEMPAVGISYTDSGYSDTDDATLLQAGGLELLDVGTLELMRHTHILERELNAATHNQFEVSLAELANHRNEDFYDPDTRQLRPQYKWYPLVARNLIRKARALFDAQQALLTHLRSIQGPASDGDS
jgi:hypothetical protein